MTEILYNHDNLSIKDIEETVVRLKALIINSENEILLGYCRNTYQFPGGHLEEGETLVEGLKREIKEETGITIDVTNSKPFLLIRYFSKNYRDKGINRCNEIYYYLIRTDEKYDLKNANYDEGELEGNFELRYIDLNNIENELIKNLKAYSNNSVIVEEMLEALKQYKDMN